MTASRPDLLLVDAEEPADSGFFEAFASFFTWWLQPPRLAVPLLSAQARARGLAVEAAGPVGLPGQRRRFLAALGRAPRVVAITTVALFDPRAAADLAAEVRRRSPGSVLVLGGHGAAASAEIRALCDVYISGHGEGALARLVLALKEGLRPWEVPGVRRGDACLVMDGALRYEDILPVPAPDWDAVSSGCRTYPVEASRGCRYNCSYCGFPGRAGQVFRDPAAVAAELRLVNKAKGVRSFDFIDSSLTADAGFVRALCAELRRGPRFKWSCFSRPDALAREPGLAAEMAAAGCRRVFIGVESIHDGILAAMRRGMGRAAAEKGLDEAFGAGLKVHGNFIIGFPGETEATVRETAEFIRARPFSSLYFCTFGASEEMLALAAREPARFANLTGRPVKGWRHDGMDYARAYELTGLATRLVNKGRLWPLAENPVSNRPDRPPF